MSGHNMLCWLDEFNRNFHTNRLKTEDLRVLSGRLNKQLNMVNKELEEHENKIKESGVTPEVLSKEICDILSLEITTSIDNFKRRFKEVIPQLTVEALSHCKAAVFATRVAIEDEQTIRTDEIVQRITLVSVAVTLINDGELEKGMEILTKDNLYELYKQDRANGELKKTEEKENS